MSGFVEGVYLAQRTKASLEVVDDRPGQEGLRAICADAWPPVDVVVDQGLFRIRVGKVRLLQSDMLVRYSLSDSSSDGEDSGQDLPVRSKSVWPCSC